MSKLTRYILKLVNYFIITIVVLFALLMVGVRIFGINIYTVLSGSMEPKYKVGSLIYVDKVDIDELQIGDVITFKLTDNVIATHRIVEINDEHGERRFRTKGDANDFVDENLVEGRYVVGKPIFTIPYLGYVASFMQTKSGSLITIGIGILLVVIVIVIDSFTDNKENKINNKVIDEIKEK